MILNDKNAMFKLTELFYLRLSNVAVFLTYPHLCLRNNGMSKQYLT